MGRIQRWAAQLFAAVLIMGVAAPAASIPPTLPYRAATSARAYDPAARAVFARMTVQPSPARKVLINSTILSLKSAGLWDTLDMLQVYAAADQQAATVDWRYPARSAVVVNSPPFTVDRGFATDGFASYVDTNFDASTGLVAASLNSFSYGFWSIKTGTNTANAFGWSDGVNVNTIQPRSASNQTAIRINAAAATALISASNSSETGLFTASRASSTSVRILRNGLTVTAGVQNSGGLPAGTMKAGRTTTSSYVTASPAMAHAGTGWSTGQASTFYDIMRTYMTAVGVP